MRYFLPLLCLPGYLAAHSIAATDYMWIHEGHHVDLDAEARHIFPADFRTDAYKQLHYDDGYAALYFAHNLHNACNSLAYEVGYSFLHLGWKENPRFSEQNFNFATASIAYISTGLEDWRWVLRGGVSVDSDNFDFGQTALYYGLAWGRYQFCDCAGAHVGAFGYAGIENNYFVPVLGFDWNFCDKWTLNAIFPLKMDIEYAFNDSLDLALNFRTFGGPYKSPKRVPGGHGEFHDAIFSIYSSGLELDINAHYWSWLTAEIGGGWNFGGWINIKNDDNRHGKYYKFEGAPYVQANMSISF